MKITNKTRQIVWAILFVIALAGVIVMFIDTYGRSDADLASRVNSKGELIRVEAWHEKLIFPFYFTFISNAMAIITSAIMLFVKKTNTGWMRRLQVFMAINLLVTFLVYWATLFPNHHPDGAISWVTNLSVHLITPLLAIVAFLVQTVGNKETIKYKNIFKSAAANLLFLVVWISIALIIYFSIGASVSFDSHKVQSGAIYFFMNVIENKPLTTVIYIIAIPVAYYLFTLGAMWISNPRKK